MEHLSLSATNIGLKCLTIGSAWLGDKLITEANQASTSIYRWGHGDWAFPFDIQKSSNKMIAISGQNTYEKIGINPSRTIKILFP